MIAPKNIECNRPCPSWDAHRAAGKVCCSVRGRGERRRPIYYDEATVELKIARALKPVVRIRGRERFGPCVARRETANGHRDKKRRHTHVGLTLALSGGAMPPTIALLFSRPLERVVRLPHEVPAEAAWMLLSRQGAEACLFLNEATRRRLCSTLRPSRCSGKHR